MKTILLIFLVLFSAFLMADEVVFKTPGGEVTVEISGNAQGGSVSSGQIVENIGYKLEALEKLYKGKLGRTDDMKAKKLMDEIFAMLGSLPADNNVQVTSSTNATTSSVSLSVNINDTMDEPVVAEEQEQVTQAMSEADFGKLLSQIRNESFADDQLNVIRAAAKRNNFTVDQTARVIGVLTYSDDQISALRIMYPKVVDPVNSHNILSVFTYSDDKEEAQNIMSQ